MSALGTSVVIGILLAVPERCLATPHSDAQPAPTLVATALAATHATKGVVKAVDATSLVITRPAMKTKEMAFVLDAATQREGRVAIGSVVEVRYRTEEKQQVATAIRVQERSAALASGKTSLRY